MRNMGGVEGEVKEGNDVNIVFLNEILKNVI